MCFIRLYLKKSKKYKTNINIFFFQVEKLINIRISKGCRQFLVRWKGYGESADTWENEKDLNCPELIEKFLAKEQDTKLSKTGLTKTDKSKKSKGSSKKQTENGMLLLLIIVSF